MFQLFFLTTITLKVSASSDPFRGAEVLVGKVSSTEKWEYKHEVGAPMNEMYVRRS